MSGRQILARLALALGLVFCICLFCGQSQATPVKPDLQKILKEQRQRQAPYEPARAGWDGPEVQRAADVSPNPVLEAYGPASTARSIRAALTAAALPDPRAVLAIGVLIVLMRLLRQQHDKRRVVLQAVPIRTEQPEATDLPRAA